MENREEMKQQHESMLQVMDTVSKQNKEEISALNNTVDQLTTEMGKCLMIKCLE